jgi:hypothetical protein
MILSIVPFGFGVLDPQPIILPLESRIFTEHTLTIASSILSILSFFLTVFVLYDTRKLRSFYKFRGAGPTLVTELRRCSKRISEFLNEFEDFIPQISEELARSIAKLESLERKLRGPVKASAKRLRKRIDGHTVDLGSEREVREIYLEMVKVVEEINDYRRDLDWER